MSSTTKHKKFGEDEENVELPPVVEKKAIITSDHDSDSDDDDAPEEEGTSNAKESVESEIKKREEALKLEQQLAKEKRRKQDTKFKEQQHEKKLREKEEEEERQRLQQQHQEENLEELPQDFFSKLENSEAISQVSKTLPTRINFNEIDGNDYLPEVKKELAKKRKNTLKKLRATTLNKGPVSVSLLPSSTSSRVMAPKRENGIMKSKDKWLKRRSINRK
ncbi:hypothetical protein NCAS_0G00370 [Naumovozyma castellii]|uniref:Uncharacterized protein n=1 Tax=Naumovozyma castellii TaxID=27288 RepID=G0VHP0_NAUCA|nr:hypothetical protein NCAS_0G00370 [Naumovozyma castellii CBS 4309]CCC70924.1 hypothetical protein NCAS_0G00370 [Naumovozyma castellii CBS 4309]